VKKANFSVKELAGTLFGRNVVIRSLNVVINVVISKLPIPALDGG
jgi:hypothetical protein